MKAGARVHFHSLFLSLPLVFRDTHWCSKQDYHPPSSYFSFFTLRLTRRNVYPRLYVPFNDALYCIPSFSHLTAHAKEDSSPSAYPRPSPAETQTHAKTHAHKHNRLTGFCNSFQQANEPLVCAYNQAPSSSLSHTHVLCARNLHPPH